MARNDYDAANAEADRPSANTRRGVGLAPTSPLRPRGSIGIYENVAFRRIACLINLPASVNSNNPQLNGLVDRYSAFANAQMVLYDLTAFPNAQGQMESAPEDFSPRRP